MPQEYSYLSRLSKMNSVLFVLLAIPPTLAAAFIIMSGDIFLIRRDVSSNENKLVSWRDDGMTANFSEHSSKLLIIDEPTLPLLPKTKTLIIDPFFYFYKHYTF